MLLIFLTALLIISIAYVVHNYFYNEMRHHRRSVSLPNRGGLMGNLWLNCFGDVSRQQSSPFIRPVERDVGSSTRHVDSLVEDVNRLQLDREIKPIGFSKQFPAVPSSATQLCRRAWADDESTELFVKAFNIEITRKDLQTLYFEKWLNDEIINFYLSLIVQRSEQKKGLPKIYAFNTFFLPALETGKYAGVKRWTKKIDIFSYDLLLIPVHLGNHWCLMVIDLIEKEANYYDSLGGINDECLDRLKNYLKEEHWDKKNREFDSSNWRFKCPRNIPKQLNGSDCGVFACCFAELASRRKELKFDPRIMPYYRQRMVYEIVNKTLL